MNVLQVISSSGFFGAEKVLVELVQAITRTQGPVVPSVGIISNSYNPHTEIADRLDGAQVPCTVFTCTSRFDLNLIFALRAFIKKNHIDIVHAHGYKSNFYALAATLFLKTKTITTIHNWIRTDSKLKVYAVIDKILLKRFDSIAVVSRELEAEVRAAALPERKIHVIKNGISIVTAATDTQVQSARAQLGIKPSYKVVGTVGRLAPEKGHIYFVRAAFKVLNDYPETRFVIIGDGPLKEELAATVKNAGYEHSFVFAGVRNDVAVCMAMMDVFVLPSLVEAMPMALLEAMAAKKLIIASRVGEIPEVISDTVNGLLVDPADVDGLSQRIALLLKDTYGAQHMADNAFRKVTSEYSSDAMACEYLKVYTAISDLNRYGGHVENPNIDVP